MRTPSSRRNRRGHKANKAASAQRSRTGLPPVLVLFLLSIVVVAVTLMTHWPVLSVRALTYDDNMYLTENELVQNPSWASAGRFFSEVLEPSTVRGYYQPLAMISLMLDCWTGGSPSNLRPFHRTALTLHVTNTVLVIVLLYRLFGQLWVAAAVGLLFGVHPMTVEPIAWIGDRKTLLAALFALGCVHAYVSFTRRRSWRSFAMILTFFALALLSKPTTTLLPVGFLVLDYWPLRRLSLRTLMEKMPLFALAGVSAIVTVISQSRTAYMAMPDESSGGSILLKLCHNVVFYPVKIIWPTHLSSYYAQPDPMSLANPMILTSVVGTAILVVGLLISLHRTRAFVAGWGFFFVMIFPTMGGIGFTPVIAADKYAYLPTVGLLMILAWALGKLMSHRVTFRRSVYACLGLILIVAVLLAGATRRYLGRWDNTEALYNYMIELAPNVSSLYNNRGATFRKAGKYPQAIRDFNRAIELAPTNPGSYYNRAIAYHGVGNEVRAIQDYNAAVRLKPDYTQAYINRGIIHVNKRDYDQAISDFTRVIELKPNVAITYNNRGIAYYKKGDHVLAMRDYARAIKLDPDNVEYWYNSGITRSNTGDYDRAIMDCTRAIQLRPGDARTYNVRANASYRKGDYDQAIRDWSKAIELKGDFAIAYQRRGNAYCMKKEYARAIQDYSHCLKWSPNDAVVYNNRGNAYSEMGDYRQAVRDYTKAIELKYDYAEAYGNRAGVFFYLKQYDNARHDMAKCKQLGGKPDPDLIEKLSVVQ